MKWRAPLMASLLLIGAIMCLMDVQAAEHHRSKRGRTIELAEGKTPDVQPSQASAVSANVPANAISQRTYVISLKELAAGQSVELRGVDGERTFPFSVRSDEVILSAKVKYGIAYSPALLPDLSHLKVTVNDELVNVVPLLRETANGIVREDTIDPRIFTEFNRLSFRLIGHYTRDCEDPLHTSLWAKLSSTSYLELTVATINLQNDLSLLPVPFFDKRENKLLQLPFVLPQSPSNDVLRSASAIASWFGHLASYRGAKFPVSLNELPKSNAVVFVAGNEVPAGLQVPAISGPTLVVMENPAKPETKLLLVMGRNGNELKIATQALTLGQLALAGDHAVVKELKDLPSRKPYDAPKWVPTDRAVKFGELVPLPNLQVSGMLPDLIRVNVRVPPDLFTWQRDGVPMDLHYRFTPRPTQDKSTLNIGINGEFVRSFSLTGAELAAGNIKESIILFFKPGHHFIAKDEVQIPAFQVGAENQLQFHFFYDYPKMGPCRDVYLDNIRSAIDADSTIDFSQMPHYAALPNLGYFANSGFPNTRMADFSETAIVMPDRPSAEEVTTLLNLMGRMGEATGYPVLEASIIRSNDAEKYGDKDFIVIATRGNVKLLKDWAKYMPMVIDESGNRLQLPTGFLRILARWDGRDLDEMARRAGDMLVNSGSNFGAMMQFQSPLSSRRSVVVLTAGEAGSLQGVAEALLKPDLRSKYQGDLVLVRGDRVENVLIGDTFYVGSLPWWTAIKWHLSSQPLILIVMLMVAALIAAALLFRFLRHKASDRLAAMDRTK